MIASEDVRRVTFDRTMRGYRCEDVDDYLKQVADSMDALVAEKEEMQKKVLVLAQRIDQYRADEDTLRTTMINAQRLGENVIKEAKQKAAEIIRAANIKAEDREQHARDEVELAQQELITIRHEADSFKKSLMDKYRKHIELLTQLPSYQEDIEPAPVEEAPAPAPEPIHEPAPEPVVEPAPAVEYEQQQFVEPDGTYYTPEVPLEAPQEEERVDTVEFALAGKGDEPPARSADKFTPGAGLYDAPEGMESFNNVDFDS